MDVKDIFLDKTARRNIQLHFCDKCPLIGFSALLTLPYREAFGYLILTDR